MSFFLACLVTALPRIAASQTQGEGLVIDPRLQELVQIVKARVEAPETANPNQSIQSSQDEENLNLIKGLQGASYSRVTQKIIDSVTEFDNSYQADAALSLDGIADLYMDYANGLEEGLGPKELQISASKYAESGNWFQKYIALEHLAYLHATDKERQAALQKAQLALSIIPESTEANIYAKFAKSNITAFIAHLHNLQGNSALALSTSFEYLKLTEDNPNHEDEIDLINNLIYAYGISRDHDAQLYLSEQLLKLEKMRPANVPGLAEMRIAAVMNDSGRFAEALEYATKSNAQAKHPLVKRTSKVFHAIALAGLGRVDEASAIGNAAGVDFSRENMLTAETRKGDLYLAFLLAQKQDPTYATQLFNRQLDVTAQKYLSNNARDTTAMLAELENSRERQAERELAARREAALQAITIDRQRVLNRTLVILSVLLGAAALASYLFMKYRVKIVGELEEKTIEAASAEKLKTEFLGMISHELRTPLNGIIGISDVLANYHEDPDIREKTSIVLRSGQELLGVVESLTDMARLDAGQLRLVPHVSDLSQSLSVLPTPWRKLAEEKNLIFTHHVDPTISQHYIDEDRLLQCLNILLSNAVRFTQAGRVHLHITADQSADGEVSGLTAIVADTGLGMSELVQSRLFTPFMQADTSRKRTHMGTGLSLAIAYALAEMMEGELSVVSREGRGSEFTLKIPLATAIGETNQISAQPSALPEPEMPTSDLPVMERSEAPQREFIDLMKPRSGQALLHDVVPTPPSDVTADGLRILLVDDLESNRDVLNIVLKTKGHICSEAGDGYTAITLLKQNTFDLVILDVHMEPLDGVETLRFIRNSGQPYENIPVVILTADPSARTNAACMEAGADLFLTKPVNQDELFQLIEYLQSADTAPYESLEA